MRITLFGTPDSVYTRIIQLILNFKNIGHDIVMADIFGDFGMRLIKNVCLPERRC